MSEKPVASIKTLARYEPDTVYIGTGEYVAECVRADDGDYYLAADVDAAIEALRAEVDALATDENWEVHQGLQAREALRDLLGGERERETWYTWRTDAAHCGLWADSVDEALATLVREGEWAEIGSDREARDIADGAWLTIFEDGVPVLRRGQMP